MPIQVLVAARYDMAAQSLFDRARSFGDLIEMTRRISVYDGLPDAEMQEGATYRTDIRIFGLVRCNDYEIRVNKICGETLRIETLESNANVRLWSHQIQIKPTETGAIWVDHVILDAGLTTPVVARYARFMYRHRHRTRGGAVIESRLSRTPRSVTPQVPLFHPAE